MEKPLAPLEVRVMKKHKSKWESRMMTFSGREIRWEGKKEKKTLLVSAVQRVAESPAAPNSLMKNCGLTLELYGGKIYTICCVSERQKKDVMKQYADMKLAMEREVKEAKQKELDEKRRLDEEKKRVEDAKREEARKIDDERKRVEEERRKAEEAKREEVRKIEELQRRRADDERKRAEEERKKLDERRRVEETRRAVAAAEVAARQERERKVREEVEQARIAAQVQALRQETQTRERMAREERERVAREQKEAAQEKERERLAREIDKTLPQSKDDKERAAREQDRARLRKAEEERREAERHRLRNLEAVKVSASRLGIPVSAPAVAAVGSPVIARMSPPRRVVEAPAMLSVTIPLTISPKSPFNPTAKLGGEKGVNFQHIRTECNCLVDMVLEDGGLALRLDARTPGDLAAGERLGRSLVEAVEKQYLEWNSPPPKRPIPERVLSAKRESVAVSYDSIDLPITGCDSDASTIGLDEYPTEIVEFEPPMPMGRPREMTTGLDGILENLLPGERLRASMMLSMEDLEDDAKELLQVTPQKTQKESSSVIEVEDMQSLMEREMQERMTEYEF